MNKLPLLISYWMIQYYLVFHLSLTLTSPTFFWTHIYFSPSSSLVLSFPSLFPHHLNHQKLADYVPPPQPSRRSTRPFSALSLADSSRPRRNRSPEAQVSFESLLKIVLGEIFLWVCAVISFSGIVTLCTGFCILYLLVIDFSGLDKVGVLFNWKATMDGKL